MRKLDWKWTISTCIAAIALIAAVLQLTQGPKEKSLSLRVDDVAPIKIDASLGLKLLLDDKLITKPVVAVVTVVNSGGTDIRQADFERPLELDVGDHAKLVKVIDVRPNPKTLRPITSVTDRGISLQPLLLNSGDEITFQILLSGESPTFAASARIAGIKMVSTTSPDAPKPKGFAVIYAVAFLVLGGILIRGFFDDLPPKAVTSPLKVNEPMAILFLLGGVGLITSGITIAEGGGLIEYLGLGLPKKELSLGAVIYILAFFIVALVLSWIVERVVNARISRVQTATAK